MRLFFALAALLLFAYSARCQTPKTDSAQYYLYKGDSLFSISEYKEAQQTLIKGLKHAEPHPLEKTKMLNSLANVLTYLGDKEGALAYYQDALRSARNTKDVLKYEAILYKNISALYQENADYKMAFEYMAKAENAGKAWNDTLFIADLYNNKGLLLEYVDSLQAAYDSYSKAFTIFKELNNDERMALCANNLGVVCKNMDREEEAILHYNTSLQKADLLNNDFLKAANNINLGVLYTKTKNYDLASRHLNEGLTISKAISQPDLIGESLNSLAELYEAKGDFRQAFQYQKQFQETRDSILNQARIDAVAELETRFGLEKKDLELTSMTQEKLLVEEENQKKQLYILLLALACLLLIGGIVVGFRINKLKSHKRSLELIAQTEKQERDRIAQDMHDELGSGISRINWITNTAQRNASSEEDKTKFSHIEGIAAQLATSMKSLIWLLYSGDCELQVLVGRIREMAGQCSEDFGYELQFHFNEHSAKSVIKQNAARDIFLMIKECVNNVSKHAQASELTIAIDSSSELLSFSIKDNGKGFDNNSASSGHGLNNLKKRALVWDMTAQVESGTEIGTSVLISGPASRVVV